MNKLEVMLNTKYIFEPVLECNGKVISFEKNKGDTRSAIYETDEDVVNVKIYSMPNELLVRHWFLRFLYYYLISFLGIFDWDYRNNPYGVCYEAVYHLDGDLMLNLKWNNAKEGAKAFKLKDETSPFIDNVSNVYTYDKRVKSRYKGMLAFKILSWIAVVATAVLVAIF